MATIQVITGESGRLIVQFPYSSERVAAIKSVPGRQWHPKEKHWTVPHTQDAVERMQTSFTADRLVIAASIQAASPQLPVKQVSKLVTALDEELTLRGYSDSTRDNYRLQV